MANKTAAADHLLTTPNRPVSGRFANLFNLRWVLGRYGFDPCDEWDIDSVLGLPEGLSFIDGQVRFECRSCGNWTEWPVDVADFELDHDANVCGGSPRCLP